MPRPRAGDVERSHGSKLNYNVRMSYACVGGNRDKVKEIFREKAEAILCGRRDVASRFVLSGKGARG
jgi:hypothetical protein